MKLCPPSYDSLYLKCRLECCGRSGYQVMAYENGGAEHRTVTAVQEAAAWGVDVGAMTARTALKAKMPRARLTAAAAM